RHGADFRATHGRRRIRAPGHVRAVDRLLPGRRRGAAAGYFVGVQAPHPARLHHFPGVAVPAHGAHLERRRLDRLPVPPLSTHAQEHALGQPDEMKINHVTIDASNWPSPQLAAAHELLRQRAVELERLADQAADATTTAAIEKLLGDEVDVPEPSADECRRWYNAHRSQYRNGELVHA